MDTVMALSDLADRDPRLTCCFNSSTQELKMNSRPGLLSIRYDAVQKHFRYIGCKEHQLAV